MDYAINTLLYIIGNKHYGTLYSRNCDAHGPIVPYSFEDASLKGEIIRRSRIARIVKLAIMISKG